MRTWPQGESRPGRQEQLLGTCDFGSLASSPRSVSRAGGGAERRGHRWLIPLATAPRPGLALGPGLHQLLQRFFVWSLSQSLREPGHPEPLPAQISSRLGDGGVAQEAAARPARRGCWEGRACCPGTWAWQTPASPRTEAWGAGPEGHRPLVWAQLRCVATARPCHSPSSMLLRNTCPRGPPSLGNVELSCLAWAGSAGKSDRECWGAPWGGGVGLSCDEKERAAWTTGQQHKREKQVLPTAQGSLDVALDPWPEPGPSPLGFVVPPVTQSHSHTVQAPSRSACRAGQRGLQVGAGQWDQAGQAAGAMAGP